MKIYRLFPALCLLAACGAAPPMFAAPDFSITVPPGWSVVEGPIQGYPHARAALLRKDELGRNLTLIIEATPVSTGTDQASFEAGVFASTKTMDHFVEDASEQVHAGGGTQTLRSYHAVAPGRKDVERFLQLPVLYDRTGYYLQARLPEDVSKGLRDETAGMMAGFAPRTPPATAAK